MKVYKISAVTLSVKDMEKSCKFYSRIPGFRIAYGGSNADAFTTFRIGKATKMYLNLESEGRAIHSFLNLTTGEISVE